MIAIIVSVTVVVSTPIGSTTVSLVIASTTYWSALVMIALTTSVMLAVIVAIVVAI